MRVSVCIATYNGAKFIKEQLESILAQLNEFDEVIIVDDCSIDNTIDVINYINDNRIKLFSNNLNRGHVFSFGRAISLASNDIIFLSDQDDIWLNNKVPFILKKLCNSSSLLVSSNMNFIDTNGSVKLGFHLDGVKSDASSNHLFNILDVFIGKSNYFGCTMAFKKELKDYIIPIPNYVESHDLWIALTANLLRLNLHLDEFLLSRRIHGNNASVINRPILLKLRSRILFIVSIMNILFRILTIKR